MNHQNQDGSFVSKPSQISDKQFFIVLHKIIKILQKYIRENNSQLPSDQKYQKSDFLFKIIDYFMLDVDSKQIQEKTKNCQKYSVLKSILLNYLKISPELLQFLSEKIALKITKGKFELSMVLHLSKNITKSKSFEKPKTETFKKIAQSSQNSNEKNEQAQKQNSFKVKMEMPTFQSEKQFELQQNHRTHFQVKNAMKVNETLRNSEPLPFVNNRQFWSPYNGQQYNQLYFPQFYYYGMQ